MYINKQKTIEEFKGIDNIKFEDLGLIMRQSGLLVKVHVGRARGAKKVNLKALGIKDEKVLDFMKEYFKEGEFNYIGVKNNKKFNKVESNLRKELSARAIGYDGQFLTIDDYKEFKNIFEKEKKRYFEIRDFVFNEWDNIITDFKCNLKKSLYKMGCEDVNVYKSILDSIPDKDNYKNSFYMNISLKAFPILENAQFFDFDDEISELLEDTQENELTACLKQITGNILSLAFDTLDNVMQKCSSSGKVNYRTKKTISTTNIKMKRRNIIGNEFISNLIKIFEQCDILLDNKQYDDFLEKGEDVLIKIFSYLKELNLLDFINFKEKMYSRKELESLCNLNNQSLLKQSYREKVV